jgi:hypothetical protein
MASYDRATGLQNVFRHSSIAELRKLLNQRSTRYTGRMEFEWDPDKAAANLRKQ